MKKKAVIICLIVLITLIISGFCLIYTHSSKETDENKSNFEQNNPTKKEETNNSVDNFEKNEEKLENNSKEETKEEIKESYTQPIEKENKKEESYTQQSTSSKKDDNKNQSITSSQTQESSNTEEVKKEEIKIDDDTLWKNFINDPETLRILGGYITKYETYESAYKKAQSISHLGYSARSIELCTPLSTGDKCAYGIKATVPIGLCENTSEISVKWWENENIDVITYLKSIGYVCEGKSW